MIVITGMHCPGTALLSHWLDAAGLPFGPPTGFYGATAHHPRGDLDEQAVVDLNTYLLTGLTRSAGPIHRVADQALYLAQPSGIGMSRRVVNAAERMRELADSRKGVAVTDPRFCLTVSAWDAATAAVETTVVAVRDPAVVAESLHRHQRIPHRLGYRFWAHHAQSILTGADRHDRFFVDMDRAMTGEDLDTISERLADHLDYRVGPNDLLGSFDHVFSSGSAKTQAHSAVPARVDALYQQLTSRC